tara:strand:+ start:479 stop:1867 length:1389 start_codon:yes stop_codon:yes gene_type:complete
MLSDFLIHKNSSIKHALKKVSTFYGKIICVVDNKNKLLGVITSGDIRRAVLKGLSLKDKINKIYKKKFTFVYQDELKKNSFVRSNFKNKDLTDSIYYIPILNNKGKVINVLSTERIIEKLENKTKKQIKKRLPKILIVGGAGYIGTVLASKLLNKNYHVTIVDKLLYDRKVINVNFKKKFSNFRFLNADICDLNVQINVVRDIDIVIFLAEIVGDPACNARPEDALKTNYLSLSSMAQLCSHINLDKFIYTSSCSVYGLDKNNKILNEKSNLNPISHYARMKIMSEKVLLNNKNEIFRPTILRLGTVFGPSLRNRFDLVVNTMAKNAYYNKKINIHGGTQWRPNIHVEDVADGIISIIKSKKNRVGDQIFNLSSDISNLQIKELGVMAKKVFSDAELKIEKNLIDNRNYKVSSKKLFNATNFRAKKNIISAYKEFKKIFKKNNKLNPDKKIYSNIKIINEKR